MMFQAVRDKDGNAVLYDMYVGTAFGYRWIGSRRTIKQCMAEAGYIMGTIEIVVLHDDVS